MVACPTLNRPPLSDVVVTSLVESPWPINNTPASSTGAPVAELTMMPWTAWAIPFVTGTTALASVRSAMPNGFLGRCPRKCAVKQDSVVSAVMFLEESDAPSAAVRWAFLQLRYDLIARRLVPASNAQPGHHW